MRFYSKKGFTLIELLVVIAIIGILSAVVLASLNSARNKAYLARSQGELREVAIALELYADSHGGDYPSDVSRDLPSGIEQYLGGDDWPDAPWPGSVYDWDNWAPGDLSHPPYEQVYQISVRFCPSPSSPITDCTFPDEDFVDGTWDAKSAVYYCVQGPCRSHSSELADHPGHCLNC